MRPFQCRTFPLTPHITEDGILTLIYNDEDLPYSCPLIDEEIPLNDDFVRATYTVSEIPLYLTLSRWIRAVEESAESGGKSIRIIYIQNNCI